MPRPFDKGVIYKLVTNRIYIGMAVHKGTAYPGEHRPIISQKLWDQVQAILQASPRVRANRNRSQTPALLKGLIFDPDGRAMSPTHTRKGGRLYRYYVSQRILKEGADDCPVGRVPAGDIEAAVLDQIGILLRQPEVIAATARHAIKTDPAITEDEVRASLLDLDPLWNELFPAEQARIAQLVVERIDVTLKGVDIRLRIAGLEILAREMRAKQGIQQHPDRQTGQEAA